MPTFSYTAMDSQGKEQKGKLDAASEEEVAKSLKEKGLFPMDIKASKRAKVAKSGKSAAKPGPQSTVASKGLMDKILNINFGPVVIRTKDLKVITRQLAILLGAGLPLIRSLRTLERQTRNAAVRLTLNMTANSVEGGSTFSEALAQHPRSFDKLYLNMVRAGEAAGAMETILDRLAMFMEKAAKISGKVKSALIYPLVVLTISSAITAGLMIFIVPKFKKVFEDLLKGEALPPLTQFVMRASDILAHQLLLVVAILVVIFIAYKLFARTHIGRTCIDWVKYNIPVFGPVVAKSAISRFSRTLGTLMSSGVPVLNALNIVKETAGNEVVANAVQKVHDAVKEGETMAAPLGATRIFPAMVISMIEVGEETGKLPEMLEKIADTYEEEVDNAVNAMTSLIEPIMIIGLAVIIGTIVIAMFMPLVAIMQKL
ncbi:MAG: type II secretion system F family protein [Victivallales bacterium]|nr:type II secretion system F family protein [Victivallales bacterium]